jgi:hypothetical protein
VGGGIGGCQRERREGACVGLGLVVVGRKAAAGGSLVFSPSKIPVLPRPRTVVSSYAVVG